MDKRFCLIPLALLFLIIFAVMIREEKKAKEPIELKLIKERLEQTANNWEVTFGDAGSASWYDYTLDSGWSSVGHYVCASRDFERYSMLRVVNIENGKSTGCLVTDYVENKDVIIDLSSTAFAELAPLSQGIIKEVSVSQIN